MKKTLPETPFTLIANKPERIWIINGINLKTTEITFRYPPAKKTQQIKVRFGDSSGRGAEEPVSLPTKGSLLYQMDISNTHKHMTPSFAFMEITSYEDMSLEVFIEETKATFN